jgi:ATP-binding cassette, subfamily C (CFTR/MRP), member 1
VAEFDTPLNLYDQGGSIFHSLCSEASLGRSDIVRIREGFRVKMKEKKEDVDESE